MQSSLAKPVDNLVQPGKNIPVQVLQERFPNTYKLSHNNDVKFKLLLRKGVYLYEYMVT